MPLNPQDIVRKEFREALRGYNQSDVDLFLDEIVEEFTRLADENQKMKVGSSLPGLFLSSYSLLFVCNNRKA